MLILVGCAALLGGCGGHGSKPTTRRAITPTAPARGGRPATGGRGRRPNILFVLTDDLSVDLLRSMPHVRRLERRGTRFTRYVVSDSLCCPSRTSIFTGRYPHDTGVFTNVGFDGGYTAWQRGHNARSTFATTLQRAGYRTGMLGKYINGYDPKRRGVPRGWDDWAVTNQGYAEYDYILNVDGRPERHGHRPADYFTTQLQERALRFLDGRGRDRRPFALEVATFAPHSPAVPAPRDTRRYPRVRAARSPAFDHKNVRPPRWLAGRGPLTRAQLGRIDALHRRRVRSVLAVDRMIGRLEDRLRALGLAKDTYVVFSSDNGFHEGQHRLTSGKLTAFDSDVRVPLVVAGPHVPAGRRIGRVTQNVDLRPTFEAIGGVPPATGIDGRSLLGLLTGSPPAAPWRSAALIEHHGPDIDPGDPDLQSVAAGEPTSYEALRTSSRTYVEYRDGERELYDDRADPLQRRNVITGAPAKLVASLHAELTRLVGCRGGQCSAPRARRRRPPDPEPQP